MKFRAHFFQIMLSGIALFSSSILHSAPLCSKAPSKPLIVAYLGADASWQISGQIQEKLQTQLQHVDAVNYAFVRINPTDSTLSPSPTDISNIQTLRQIRPDLPIILAVGGWGGRDEFQAILHNDNAMTAFVDSVESLLNTYQLDGIDVDWENEELASDLEIKQVATLIKTLNQRLHSKGYCITNAVPATQAYWTRYPHAASWQPYVDWTTVMAYDHYGTFGPRTELASGLYAPARPEDTNYPYPTTSGDSAIRHYLQEGLTPNQILLGVPFYCHRYYIVSIDGQNSQGLAPGLYAKSIDPNLNSQLPYELAFNQYGKSLFNASVTDAAGHTLSYGLIPLTNTAVTQFVSCDSPDTLAEKSRYVLGQNELGKLTKLGGISFWSLQQDLPYENEQALLPVIAKNLSTGK